MLLPIILPVAIMEYLVGMFADANPEAYEVLQEIFEAVALFFSVYF